MPSESHYNISNAMYEAMTDFMYAFCCVVFPERHNVRGDDKLYCMSFVVLCFQSDAMYESNAMYEVMTDSLYVFCCVVFPERRNVRGDDRLYVCLENSGYSFVKGLYENNLELHCETEICIDGMRGTVLIAEDCVRQGGSLNSPVMGLPVTYDNHVYWQRRPTSLCFVFRSEYRQPINQKTDTRQSGESKSGGGISFPQAGTRFEKEDKNQNEICNPPRVLKPGDLTPSQNRSYRPQIGMARATQRASLGDAGHRMVGHHTSRVVEKLWLQNWLLQIQTLTLLSSKEWKLAGGIVEVMKPFTEATTEACGNAYPTASMIIPMLHCLEATMDHINALCTIVDPQYKAALFNEEERFHAVNLLRQALLSHVAPETQANGTLRPAISTGSMWDELDKVPLTVGLPTNSVIDTHAKEIENYLAAPRLYMLSNPYNWWKKHKEEFGAVAYVAEQFLAIPPSCGLCSREIPSYSSELWLMQPRDS
uniref:HAT C-terminal dimerisation domain-containing protein n=1 Tax=Timema genevievae TaxID=629358 RepID=A0A7R9JPN2_TIMGE|nr:unnamed protein product [Timema genevievae]